MDGPEPGHAMAANAAMASTSNRHTNSLRQALDQHLHPITRTHQPTGAPAHWPLPPRALRRVSRAHCGGSWCRGCCCGCSAGPLPAAPPRPDRTEKPACSECMRERRLSAIAGSAGHGTATVPQPTAAKPQTLAASPSQLGPHPSSPAQLPPTCPICRDAMSSFFRCPGGMTAPVC